jgi:ABC-2 type transport system ATP-binding protein
MSTRLYIKDLSKETAKRAILDDVSLGVHEGEIFALIGHYNSGKSLLNKMIVGVSHRTSGDVLVEGINNNSLKRWKSIRKVGAVIDQQAFDKRTTGYKAVRNSIAINVQSVGRARIVNIMNLLGIKRVMNHTINRYNKSQIQRLKIAIALVTKPDILVLDEPFKNLTAEEATNVRVVLKSLASNDKTAILIATRRIVDVDEICDTIGVIDDGMMVHIKSYDEMIRGDAAHTKVRVMTKVPNLTAKLIEETLKVSTHLSGSDVIVHTPPSEAERIAALLNFHEIPILGMKRENRSLQEIFCDVAIRRRRNAGVRC